MMMAEAVAVVVAVIRAIFGKNGIFELNRIALLAKSNYPVQLPFGRPCNPSNVRLPTRLSGARNGRNTTAV
ncbi:hypothetical protein ACLB1G_25310 [Oxalobacteraceae bacterium A2-2]